MGVIKFTCALITRTLFILVSLVGVWRVTMVKKDDPLYWSLTLLLLPLVLEMIVTMKRRRGEDYRWFSPPIFLFLVCIIPSIWILELDHRLFEEHGANETLAQKQCRKLDIEGIKSLALNSNITGHEIKKLLLTFCPNEWNLALHHILLILLIVGRWLLPLGGGVTRDELSQLLLIFIGTAADILEFSGTLDSIPETKPNLVYVILSVWSWSMLQFPVHMSVVSSRKDDGDEQVDQEESLWSKHSTDLCSIIESFFIQDGPFLVTRIIVMVYCSVLNQMLGFFAIKNILVISLNLYRLVVICQNYRQSSSSSSIELAEP